MRYNTEKKGLACMGKNDWISDLWRTSQNYSIEEGLMMSVLIESKSVAAKQI